MTNIIKNTLTDSPVMNNNDSYYRYYYTMNKKSIGDIGGYKYF